MQRVFLCVCEMKSLEILNQMKQIVVLKHWINNITKIVLKHWIKWNKGSLLLNLFLSLMWLKGISILFIEYATWQNFMLSCMRSLLIYIYIYIYIYWFITNVGSHDHFVLLSLSKIFIFMRLLLSINLLLFL